MTQFNSENEMSDQVSMYFDTLGELEEKDQEAIQNKYPSQMSESDQKQVRCCAEELDAAHDAVLDDQT